MKKLFLIAPFLMACPVMAQFTVESGAGFYIASGALVAIDGLTMQPSANFTLNGVTITTSPAPLATPVTIARVYDFTAPVSFSGTLGILYADGELNGLTEASLKVGTRPNTGASFAAAEGSTVDADANYVSAVYATAVSLGQVTAFKDDQLPVTLVAFTAARQEQSILLTWQTTDETDFSHFGAERSRDAKNWERIGEVVGKGGGSGLETYNFSDHLTAAAALRYYRLRLVDLDGTFSYSKIVSVTWEVEEAVVGAYPNPATDYIKIEVPARPGSLQSRLILYDVLGRRLGEVPVQAGVNVVDVRNLVPGMYFGVVNNLVVRWVKE